jgi:hypothetical protein
VYVLFVRLCQVGEPFDEVHISEVNLSIENIRVDTRVEAPENYSEIYIRAHIGYLVMTYFYPRGMLRLKHVHAHGFVTGPYFIPKIGGGGTPIIYNRGAGATTSRRDHRSSVTWCIGVYNSIPKFFAYALHNFGMKLGGGLWRDLGTPETEVVRYMKVHNSIPKFFAYALHNFG